MKKRSALISILALVLTLSLIFVGCSGKSHDSDGDYDYDMSGNTSPNVNCDPENDMRVISEAIGNRSIYSLLTEAVESVTASMGFINPDGVVNSMKKLEFETNATLSLNGSKPADLYVGVSDGITKVTTEDETVYMSVTETGDVVAFEDFGNGYHETDRLYTLSESLASFKELLAEYENVDVDSVLGMYAGTPMEEILDYEFPRLDKEHLELDGGYYVIQDSYYDVIVSDLVEITIEMVKAEGGEDPDEEDIREAEELFGNLIDSLGLKLGFAVIEDNIVGFLVSVDADTSALNDLTGEGRKFSLRSASDEVFKLVLEVGYADDASSLKLVSFYADIVENGRQTVKADIEYRADGNKYTLDLRSFSVDNEVDIKGKLSFEFLTSDEGDIVGIESEIDINMEDVSIDGKAYINFADLSMKGADVIDVDLDMEVYGEKTNIKIDGKVIEVGVIEYDVLYELDGDEMVINGEMNFNSVDLGDIPAGVKNAA